MTKMLPTFPAKYLYHYFIPVRREIRKWVLKREGRSEQGMKMRDSSRRRASKNERICRGKRRKTKEGKDHRVVGVGRARGEGEGAGAWTCARATSWNSQHWLREGAWRIEGVSHRPSAQQRARKFAR